MDKLRIKFFFFHYRNDQLSRTEKLHNCRIIFINFTRVVYQIISNDTTRYPTVISERVYVFYRQRCCFLKYFVYNAYSRRYIYSTSHERTNEVRSKFNKSAVLYVPRGRYNILETFLFILRSFPIFALFQIPLPRIYLVYNRKSNVRDYRNNNWVFFTRLRG